ncbi:hypothetical protein NQZ68_005859 [Dissostichus eleginoides]|nr:hypothetical protein NQZ68_005859 [Dissostichus eleginoides]
MLSCLISLKVNRCSVSEVRLLSHQTHNSVDTMSGCAVDAGGGGCSDLHYSRNQPGSQMEQHLQKEYGAGSVYFIMRGRLGNGQSHLVLLEPGHVGILSLLQEYRAGVVSVTQDASLEGEV